VARRDGAAKEGSQADVVLVLCVLEGGELPLEKTLREQRQPGGG
jgi:hypothetical protein